MSRGPMFYPFQSLILVWFAYNMFKASSWFAILLTCESPIKTVTSFFSFPALFTGGDAAAAIRIKCGKCEKEGGKCG